MSETRELTPEARAELISLHTKLETMYADFQAARQGFIEFVKITRVNLGIPSNEFWDLNKDATAFVKLSEAEIEAIPGMVAAAVQQSIEEETPKTEPTSEALLQEAAVLCQEG